VAGVVKVGVFWLPVPLNLTMTWFAPEEGAAAPPLVPDSRLVLDVIRSAARGI
jgi:hypothetical protein